MTENIIIVLLVISELTIGILGGYQAGKQATDAYYARQGCVKLIAPLKYKVPEGEVGYECFGK
jgi:hypothetical protein